MFENQGQQKQLSEMRDLLAQLAKDMELQRNEMQKITEQMIKENEELHKEINRLVREVEAQRTEIKHKDEQIIDLQSSLARRDTRYDANALAAQVALGYFPNGASNAYAGGSANSFMESGMMGQVGNDSASKGFFAGGSNSGSNSSGGFFANS